MRSPARCSPTATRPATRPRAGICACSRCPRRHLRADAAPRRLALPRAPRPPAAATAGRGGAAVNPFGAGCPGGGRGGGGGGGGFGGAGGANPGPFVLPGTYTVSLVVDGKTVDSKPLKVNADPEVALTAVERKKMYDMAMEMHGLQRLATDVSNALGPFNTRMQEIAKEIGGRSDVPAEVKTEFEAVNKALAAVVPKFAPGGGGRGGGGGGGRGATPPPSPAARVAQAKNGLMGGMPPTDATLRAYNDGKVQLPQAVAEANGVFTKAAALSTSLGKFKIALTAPAPVK